MKMKINIVVLVFITFLLCGCGGPYDVTTGKESNNIQTPVAMLEQEYETNLKQAQSNVEICEVNETYAAKWYKMVEEYYNKLLIIGTPDLCESIKESQEAWEGYKQKSLKEKEQYLSYVYTTGTIIPNIYTKFEYAINKERAEILYTMYVEVEQILEIGDGSPSQGDGSPVS